MAGFFDEEDNMEIQKESFLIIDGNSIACRAAFAKKDLKNSQGRETGGTYLFVTMLDTIITKLKPSHVVVAWDVSRENFRTKLDETYKANRESKSENLYIQFEDIKRILDAIGIKYVGVYGYEADDVIGTYSKISPEHVENYILTGDKDSFQLVNNRTCVYFPRMGVTDLEVIDEVAVKDKFGVFVEQYIDLKALMGDGGDNVIGVEGCGPKKAAALLQTYDTLENVVAHAHEVKGKLGENLRAWSPNAETVKQLVTINNEVPVPFEFEDCAVYGLPNWQAAREIFTELEFYSHIKKLNEGRFHVRSKKL